MGCVASSPVCESLLRWLTWSPKQKAAKSGILLELERLLGGVLEEHGVTVNSVNGVKQTALMFAAMEGHVDVIDVLVRAGATLDNQAVGIRSRWFNGCVHDSSYVGRRPPSRVVCVTVLALACV